MNILLVKINPPLLTCCLLKFLRQSLDSSALGYFGQGEDDAIIFVLGFRDFSGQTVLGFFKCREGSFQSGRFYISNKIFASVRIIDEAGFRYGYKATGLLAAFHLIMMVNIFM